jgi:hypothetical protein
MDQEQFVCPAECSYSGTLSTIIKHIEETDDSQHSWAALGFSSSAEFKRIARTKYDTSSTDETEIDPCPLTELYEAFRGVRTALLMAFRSNNSDINEDDLNRPIVQYEKVLAAFVGTTDTETQEILGYGPQHVERVEHKAAEYREQYGNGEWITDYRCIDVEPLSENTRQTLSSHNLVEYPSLLVKPTTPRTELPVPELVTKDEELSRALSILTRFPHKPPTDADRNASSDRFPVREVYEATLAEADVEPVDINNQTTGHHSQSRYSPADTTPHWKSSPAALTSPVTESEVDDFLAQYGKLTHLFRRIVPPEDIEVDRPIPVFALDFYDPVSRSKEPSKHSYRILSYAKNEEDRFRGYFLNRIRDFVYQRLLKDSVKYDYITVFPGHKAHSLSPSLVELAKQATVETPIVYSELLKRVETTEKQSQQDAESRWNVARKPERTLRVRHQLIDDRVIVLDDVCTSGASLAAASHLLRKAGATDVIGVALGLTRSHSHNDTEIKRHEDTASDIIEGNNGF